MKRCTKCNIKKETIEFSKGRAQCKQCRSDYLKKQKIVFRDKLLQRGREAYQKHRKQRLEDKKEYYLKNREEILEKQKQYRKDNPKIFKGYELKKNYNLSLEQFNKLLELQNNRCAVCLSEAPGGRTNQWHIDHDHKCCPKSGKTCGKCIRGLLCHQCNTGIGLLKDSVEVLNRAKIYLLKRHNESLFSSSL